MRTELFQNMIAIDPVTLSYNYLEPYRLKVYHENISSLNTFMELLHT